MIYCCQISGHEDNLSGKKGGKNTFENNLPEKAAGKSRNDGTYEFNKPVLIISIALKLKISLLKKRQIS